MKMNRHYYFLLLYFTTFSLFAQIPIKGIESEIKNLKTADEIDSYWENLKRIDQNILLGTVSTIEYDSISLDNMIRTSLLIEIHGIKSYNPNNTVPIINLSHCLIGEAQIAFWAIILECSKTNGVIQYFGGKYPAYELESIALNFYNYSLLNQESIYYSLMNKINNNSTGTSSNKLLKIFEKQKQKNSLKLIKVIGKWNNQPFENLKEKSFFEFIKMSDASLYLKRNNRIQKLILLESKKQAKIYRIENEPFGWYYKFEKNGALSLNDSDGKKLIQYAKLE